MTFQEFLNVKAQFDQGLININNAYMDAFLFDNKWYPVHLFVNQVHQQVNNPSSIKILTLVIPYLRFKEDVSFHGCNNLPVQIGLNEKMEELNLVMARVNNMLQA